MILYPAIDLIAGRCVRLSQGDFDRETGYDEAPANALIRFADAGASWAHVVDLDGARAKEPRQHALLADLAKASPLKLQVAGGIRTPDHVAALLDAGVARVVVGSLAVNDPPAFTALLDTFGPDRLTLALDVRIAGEIVDRGKAMVATHGWAEGSGQSLDEVLDQFPAVRHLLVTDIGRDGMLTGPNIPLIQAIVDWYPAVALQASGGVATLDDLALLLQSGADGAIVGKALWEGRFTVEQALKAADA
ncbi:1-(5-phosphoribosyl)-5-[(5-phosphoribosylamino)methylideneamino]imidazole-4-carboxamide isomerase [Sphingomonas sp. RB1R13]|uniref:1-(5-phosphoribosyl)-5-[(5- phosphoribosylamino)methylideneamino]imidazole-4- carboxamide isomerase n=1 Tax=Sphingomonas sp. RB1R13 TaxID=3096159 RepID=UPI002FCC6528